MADDFILSVRQIAQYPFAASVNPANGDRLLMQQGGVGGPYQSLNPLVLFQTALLHGGTLNFSPDGVSGIYFNGARFTFGAGAFDFSEPVVAPTLSANAMFVGEQPVATELWVADLFDNITNHLVFSFNGRVGDIQLTTDDIRRAGGVPNVNPAFFGTVTAPTPWNVQANDNTVVTAAWVQQWAACSGNLVHSFMGRMGDVVLSADDVSFALSQPGVYATANTPPSMDYSNRIATTAFVDEAMADLAQAVNENAATIAAMLDADFAPLNSPQFTGIPTAPTAAPGSSTGQLATTAFVADAIVASTTGVSSFNTRTGAVVLNATDVQNAGGALLVSPAFTGTPTAPTQAPGDSSTRLATTAFVEAAVSAVATGVTSFNTRTGAVSLLLADVTAVGGAPLASPALSGTPTAPTAAPATNTTQIATTQFVTAALAALPAPVSSFNGRTGAVMFQASDISAVGGALLVSPAFTGHPTGVTEAPGDSSLRLASTAFVQAAVSAGTAGVTSFNGRSGAVTLATADVTGAGGALLASPTFTGIPAAPTATAGTNSSQLATTAFVQAALSAAPGGVSSFNSRTGAITLIGADVSAAGGALLASPALSGNPTAPTQAPATSNTTLATTAFVQNALLSAGGVNTFNGRAGAVTLLVSDIVAASGASYVQQDTAPTTGPNQRLWFDSQHGQLYVQYTDPVSSARAWLIANSPPQVAPSSGSRVLIASAVVSTAVATVDFFPQPLANGSYDVYEFEFYGVQMSAAANALAIRVSTDGATFDNGTSNYLASWIYPTNTATAGVIYSTYSYQQVTQSADPLANRTLQGRFECYGFSASGVNKYFHGRGSCTSAAGFLNSVIAGNYGVPPYLPIVGVRFLPTAGGNITAGVFKIYGVVN